MFGGWTNGERLFAVVLVCAIALTLLFKNCPHRFGHSRPLSQCIDAPYNSGDDDYAQVANGEREADSTFIVNRDAPQWLAGLAGVVSALFTIWLIVITRSSVNAARASADAARQTAEAVINIERGHLVYDRGARNDLQLHYLFLAEGKQALTILGIGHHFQFAQDERSVVAVRDIDIDVFEIMVRPGQHAGSWGGEVEDLVGMPFIRIPLDIWNRMRETDLHLVATMRILYRTSFGIYMQSHTILFTEGNANVTLWSRALTHDWPIERWDARMTEAIQEHANASE